MFFHESLLPALLVLAHFAAAQQPTPYIPATHFSVSSVPTKSPTPSETGTRDGILTPFYPSLTTASLLPNNDEAISSIRQALTSIQSTWTSGPQYASITAAVYEAAPTSARSSLSISGYDWEEIVLAPWYTGVNPAARERVQGQEEALQKTVDEMLATAGAVGNGGGRRMLTTGWGGWMGILVQVGVVLSVSTWIDLWFE